MGCTRLTTIRILIDTEFDTESSQRVNRKCPRAVAAARRLQQTFRLAGDGFIHPKLGGFAMARKPKPWFWKARNGWYVTIDGVKHNLGRDKTAAHTRFYQLMAEPQKRVVRSDSVAAIVDVFLEWCHAQRATDTYEWYRYRLERFVRRYPDLKTHQLRNFHVQQWIDSMSELKSGSHRNYCRSIKRAMKWAKQQGYVDQNPIEDFPEPQCGRREQVISQAEYERILDLSPCAEFRDLVIVTWETGCRPQESLRLDARHFDADSRRWIINHSEGKGKMGRTVYLTDKAVEITCRYLSRFPVGKTFRNSRGRPWTTSAVNCAFERLQQKMGKEIMQQQSFELDDAEIIEFSKSLATYKTVKGLRVDKTERELFVEARRKLRLREAERHAPKYSLYASRISTRITFVLLVSRLSLRRPFNLVLWSENS